MKVFIYGYLGGMGARYRAILKTLGHTAGGQDQGAAVFGFAHNAADAFIVATPTETHAKIIKDLKNCGRPILCEKPISTDLEELREVIWELKHAGTRLQMVSQYDYLLNASSTGPTYYNYFKSGKDGLFWDCINIVKHAKGEVEIRNDSPIWRCTINGHRLSLADMDQAYIDMIAAWLKDPGTTDFDGIFAAHRKIDDLEAACAS